jgi:hypothetical protein
MKHLKIKKFCAEAKKNNLNDRDLVETINEFIKLTREEQLKFSLGAGLFKLRIATKSGRGKSAGSRSLLAFQKNNGIFWLHLFSKNDKENITSLELKKLKQLSNIMIHLNDAEIEKLINIGELYEVNENE